MKIALDLRRINNPGIGRYMKCLTEALVTAAPELEYLLILPHDALDLVKVPGARAVKLSSSLKYYSVREQLEMPRILRRYKVDVLHAPHFNIPIGCPCACVATIHDVIYLACQEDLPSPLGRVYYKAMMNAAVRAADRIITDSYFSRQEIRRHLRPDCDAEVIYPAVDSHFCPVTDPARIGELKSRYGIQRDYILYTGIYKPRKNHAGLLRAFRTFLDRGIAAQLVIAGPIDGGEMELRCLAADLGLSDGMVLTGFVEDSDLPVLYSGARVYACPSLYEGFGLTVLEAMACGVPVVCSKESSLPEVAGEAAAYVDARDPGQLADVLYQVFSDDKVRTDLLQKAAKNVGRFSWRHTALETLRVYEQALASPLAEAAGLS
jgi:glycosyltransferase involved in cell wall biosynthesis